MTHRPVDREALFEALCALRDASDATAPQLGWAWRTVDRFLDLRCRRPEREHDDVRQRALLKVMGGVARMRAETAAGAEGWLRKVHQSATREHHRRRDPVGEALKRTGTRDGEGTSLVERLAAPEQARTEHDEALVESVREVLLDRVDAWLEENVSRPSKRAGDARRAQIAWMANVLGRDLDAIRAQLGIDPKRDTLYKWVERGREQVLLPVVRAWAEEDDGSEVPAALLSILEGSRRSDAGKPRPRRRSVSRRDDCTSIQSKPRGKRKRGS